LFAAVRAHEDLDEDTGGQPLVLSGEEDEVNRTAPLYSLVNKTAKKKRKEEKEGGRNSGERRRSNAGDGGDTAKRPLVSQVRRPPLERTEA
jgi:hypothetical protein